MIAALCSLLVLGACRGEPPDDRGDLAPTPTAAPEEVEEVALARALRTLGRQGANVEVDLVVDHHASGIQELSATGGFDGTRSALRVDARKAPNAAGIFGHFDRIEARFNGNDAYFEVVPGAAKWLALDLETASSFAGADIERLRELMLVNPYLMVDLLAGQGAKSDATDRFQGDDVATFDITMQMQDRASESARLLDKFFGVKEIGIVVVVDTSETVRKIEVDILYERVEGTSAVVHVEGELIFTPGNVAPVTLPPASSTRTLDQLRS